MKSIIFKKTLSLLLIATVLCSLFACSTDNRPQPEDTIYTLEDAINSLDIDTLLKCIDSKWSSRIEAMLSFPIGEDGMSVRSFIAIVKTILPIIPFIRDDLISPEDIPMVKFTILNTDIHEDSATLALAGILIRDDHTIPFATNIEMKLENNMWVVCGIG